MMDHEFTEGTEVVYGLHGRCSIMGIETRKIAGEELKFYKLQKQRPLLSRAKKNDPAIWLPVRDAVKRGLRIPMTREEAETAFETLSSQEYFFSLDEKWKSIQPKLEDCIFTEGGRGLAKVVGYLYALKNKLIVPPPEVNRFFDATFRTLVRELAEIYEEPLRTIELKIEKAVEQKLRLDH